MPGSEFDSRMSFRLFDPSAQYDMQSGRRESDPRIQGGNLALCH